jgi:hypothetical protein
MNIWVIAREISECPARLRAKNPGAERKYALTLLLIVAILMSQKAEASMRCKGRFVNHQGLRMKNILDRNKAIV